ncbi:MAG: hypothetical protein U1G07_22630 [Verrucomicrobiota bacterium]
MIAAIHVDNSGPTLSSRTAILHTAMYDAVNSILKTHQPYRFEVEAPLETSVEAAAVAAGYDVMKALYQSFGAQADDLYETWLASAPADAALTNGLALGRQVADLVLQARGADGASTEVPRIPSDLPGQWRRTPPFFARPHAALALCADASSSELESFLPPPPPPLASARYAEDSTR